MPAGNESSSSEQPRTLTVSRTFPVPRELVFQAWSSAYHLKRWFCPAMFTVPEATVEFRDGGVFELCMRSAQGQDNWMKGHFVEIVPHTRIVFDTNVLGQDDEPLFRAYTVVTFADEGAGTRVEVNQTYTILQPIAAPMIQGARQGWNETLDRLQTEVMQLRAHTSIAELPQSGHSVTHATFHIERDFEASPAQVFKALTEPDAKSKWFSGGPGFVLLERTMDVRPGGRERLKGRWPTGMVSCFDAVYFDIVPDARLVYAYEMHIDNRKISVSLATFELTPTQTGTRLLMSEQGAYLDGYDDAGSREQGSKHLLDALANSLKQ